MKISHLIALISITAFTASCSHFSHHGKSCGHHKKKGEHFSKLDKDGNGSLSKSEWNDKFKSIDTNKDGKLTADEMKVHHKSEKRTCDKH